MTKAQHTPGPWTQGSNYEVVAMDGTNICKVHNDEGQGAANARLIAKVPAMLEALRALSEQFERFAPFDSQAEIRAADEARAILSRIGETE
jgi:hypothetical protein